MLAYLANFVVGLANLAEAEGRLVKRGVFKLAAAIACLVFAATISLVAILGLFAAFFLALAPHIGPPGALAIVSGVLLVVLGFVSLVLALLLGR